MAGRAWSVQDLGDAAIAVRRYPDLLLEEAGEVTLNLEAEAIGHLPNPTCARSQCVEGVFDLDDFDVASRRDARAFPESFEEVRDGQARDVGQLGRVQPMAWIAPDIIYCPADAKIGRARTFQEEFAQTGCLDGNLPNQLLENLLIDREVVQHGLHKSADKPPELRGAVHA